MQREASDKEKAKDLPTFKDNDFINARIRIQIGDESKERLMANIQADVQVLWQVLTVSKRRELSILSLFSVPGHTESHGLQSAGGRSRFGSRRAGGVGARG